MKRVIIAAAVAALSLAVMAETTRDYVQDGLVACWDGIENGGTARTHVSRTPGETFLWRDVVGNRAFTMLSDAQIEPDRVRFLDTADSRGSLTEEDSSAVFNACRDGTVELVFYGGTANTAAIFLYCPSESGIVVGRKSSYFVLSYGTSNKRTSSQTCVNATNTFALSYSNGLLLSKGGLYVNGVSNAVGSASQTYGENSATESWIGGGSSGVTPCNGAIYAIRCYSRKLTPEEIAANAAVDAERFFGGRGVTFSQTAANALSATLTADVNEELATGCSAKVCYGASPDALTETQAFGETFGEAGSYDITIRGLAPATTNYAQLVLTSGNSETPVSPVIAFTTAAVKPLPSGTGIGRGLKDYAQTGLVAHWDGVKNVGANSVHSDETKRWVDCLGGRAFDLRGVTVGDSYLQFAGATTSYGVLDAAGTKDIFETYGPTGTIEIAVMETKSANSIVLKSTFASGVAIGWTTTSGTILSSAAAASCPPLAALKPANYLDKFYVLSPNYTKKAYAPKVYVNGVANTPTGSNSNWETDVTGTYIGRRGGGATNSENPYTGKIYAIRVYDHNLTAEEAAQNYAVDVERFVNGNCAEPGDLRVEGGLGTSVPVDGLYEGLAVGEPVACSCATATTDPETGDSLVSMGYVVYTNGVVCAEGTTNEFTYVHPDCATGARLVWRWAKVYAVTVSAGEHGSVSETSFVAVEAQPHTIAATPDEGYHFVKWEGDLPVVERLANPLALKATKPLALRAVFAANGGDLPVPVGEDFSKYAHKAFITFSGYAGTTALTNFPALVKLSEGLGGFSYQDCKLANGGDVRFTLGDGVELPSEVVTWNSSGTSEFWVRVPELTAETRIMVFWGNVKAKARNPALSVWDETYRAVHSHEEVGCALLDKTRFGNHGAMTGGTRTNGVVGAATAYGAATGWYGDLNDSGFCSVPFSAELWVRREDAAAGRVFVVGRGGTSGSGSGAWAICYSSDNKIILKASANSGGDRVTVSGMAFGEWHHVLLSYSNAKSTFIVDGVSRGSWSGSLDSSRTSLPLVGATAVTGYWKDNPFTGLMDELRYSNVARSADYARAVFLNAMSNEVFQVVEAAPASATGIAVEGEKVQETGEGVRYVPTGAETIYADGVPVESAPTGARHLALVTPMKKQYRVMVAAGAGGTVTPALTDAWTDAGTELAIEATATAADRAFYAWQGGVPTTRTFEPKTVVCVDRPLAVTAQFGTLHTVTPESTLENEVAAIAAAGDYPSVIFVADGVYTATNPVSTSPYYAVTITNAIAVKAVNPGKAVFNVGGVQTRGWFKLTSTKAYLEGLVVSNYVGSTTGGDGKPGTGYYVNSSGGKIANCRFERATTCARTRSAVRLEGGWMRNSVLRNLKYQSSPSGGESSGRGLQLSGGVLVENCVVTNCEGIAGSAVGVVGACVLRDSLFADCTAKGSSGGAIYCAANGLILENCTVAGCSSPNKGGGIYTGNPLMAVNCLVGANTAKTPEDGHNLYGSVGQTHVLCPEAVSGNGNIVGTPAFDDESPYPYYPANNSLSRDAGLYQAWAAAGDAVDLAGTNRVLGSAIDIGAWEFPPPAVEQLSCTAVANMNKGTDTLTVDFTVRLQGDTDEITYAWDFGDGTTSDLPAPTHTYAKPGYYNVTLTVTNGKGETDTFAEEGMIKVYPTVCYVSNKGSGIEPFGSPETATNSIAAVMLVGPKKIVILPGAYVVRTGIAYKDVEVVGDSPINTFVTLDNDYRSLMSVSGGAFRNLTIQNFNDSFSPTKTAVTLSGDGTVVSNCVFTGFTFGTRDVTAIKCSGSNVKMIDCAIINVKANGATGMALGISSEATGFVMERCVISNFVGNSANMISVGNPSVAPVFRNVLIAQNSIKGENGTCFKTAGKCVLENCTVVSNTVATGGTASGIYVSGAGVAITNTIAWGNLCQDETGWVPTEITVKEGVSAVIANCCTNDPHFNFGVRRSEPYWSLRGASPCRNKGVKSAWMDGATDLVGNPRVFDGKPDIGCYEAQVGGTVIIVR